MLDAFKAYVQSWVERNIQPIRQSELPDVGQWLEGTDYPAWRKKELLDTWEAGRPAGWKKCKSFGKRETYMAFKNARGINSRSDWFKCRSGPAFSVAERRLFADPSFIKHVPVRERPGYLLERFQSRFGRFYVTDYSHFESHFVRSLMLSCECVLYRHMFKEFPQLSDEIVATLTGRNVCNFKHFRIGIDAVRMSGDMCTSLGNGFTNYMLANFVVFRKCGQEPTGIYEGDDGLFLSPVEVCTEDFRVMGFDIKIERYHDLFETSFCGMVISEDLCHMVDPVKTLVNFGWTHSPMMLGGRNVRLGLLRAKSLSLLYENPRCPIVSVLARRMIALTEGVTPRWDSNWYERQLVNEVGMYSGWAFQEAAKGISQQTRSDFYRIFGIPPSRQEEIEAYLSTLQVDSIIVGLDDLLGGVPDCAEYWRRFVVPAGSIL